MKKIAFIAALALGLAACSTEDPCIDAPNPTECRSWSDLAICDKKLSKEDMLDIFGEEVPIEVDILMEHVSGDVNRDAFIQVMRLMSAGRVKPPVEGTPHVWWLNYLRGLTTNQLKYMWDSDLYEVYIEDIHLVMNERGEGLYVAV